MAKAQKTFVRNRVLVSAWSGAVYFVPKAEDLGGRSYRVIGTKHLIEGDLDDLLRAALAKATAEGIQLRIEVTTPKPKPAKRRKAKAAES